MPTVNMAAALPFLPGKKSSHRSTAYRAYLPSKPSIDTVAELEKVSSRVTASIDSYEIRTPELRRVLERLVNYYLTTPALQDGSLRAVQWDLFDANSARAHWPDVWSYADTKIEELAKLPFGWDGSSAPRTAPEACNRMRRILAACTTDGTFFPAIMPDFEGGLVAEWRAGKQRIAIEVDVDGNAYAFASDEQGKRVISEALAFNQQLYETLRTIRTFLDHISIKARHLNPAWRDSFLQDSG